MDLYEYIIIAITMAMDAFAVSVCKGVASKEKYTKTGLVCGIWFGGFQGICCWRFFDRRRSCTADFGSVRLICVILRFF